jgi:chromosome segregation ATPase
LEENENYGAYSNEHNIDCKQIEQTYLNQHLSLRIQQEVCRMNITMYEKLAEQCRIHVLEEQSEIAELNRLIASCQAEQTAITALIQVEVTRLSACEASNTAINTNIQSVKTNVLNLLSDNRGIINDIGTCQSNTLSCNAGLAVCLDRC